MPVTRIRLGYVSPDFRAHTVTKFISAAIKHHDRERFEVFCYSNSSYEDAVTQRLKGWAEQWRQIERLDDEQAEKLIREDRIDILVDLRGHGVGNRLTLFARKPAPIQATMIGYFDTTGLQQMDYRITDAIQDPVGCSEQYHTEKLARLSGSCWCYDPDEDAPKVGPPSVLNNGFITFGSLNKLMKLSTPCLAVWARVLEAMPKSKLLLAAPGREAMGALTERLERHGIGRDRVIIVDKAGSRAEYLARFHQMDICLDPFPFNGITTSCDGLWMGVPVISVAGVTSVSRAGASILSAAGMREMAVETEDEFVKKAIAVSQDLDRLCRMRLEMRERLQSSPLLDAAKFAACMETLYSNMVSDAVIRKGKEDQPFHPTNSHI